MIVDMGQNRTYHNNWSPHVYQKSTTVKFKCKDYASKTIMAKIKINQTELITTIIYLFLVRISIIIT